MNSPFTPLLAIEPVRTWHEITSILKMSSIFSSIFWPSSNNWLQLSWVEHIFQQQVPSTVTLSAFWGSSFFNLKWVGSDAFFCLKCKKKIYHSNNLEKIIYLTHLISFKGGGKIRLPSQLTKLSPSSQIIPEIKNRAMNTAALDIFSTSTCTSLI